METLLTRVEKESSNYSTAEHAAIDHLKMAQAHLFEETEGRNIDNWLSDIDMIIQKLENRLEGLSAQFENDILKSAEYDAFRLANPSESIKALYMKSALTEKLNKLIS